MADRYWVGGTGNWSDDDNHWASSSGGSPANGNLPTSSDDVFINANSGFGAGGTISVDGVSGECNNFTSNSGHTYALDTNDGEFTINFYGSIILESGLTDGYFLHLASTPTTITTNGATMLGLNVQGSGTLTLQDNLTVTYFYQDNGTFDANDHNVTASNFAFYADTGYTPTVVMGSGTWEATGVDGGWYIDENDGEVVTVTCETSTIKLTGGGDFFFEGSSKTYHDLWITNTAYIQGSNTFVELKIDAGTYVAFDKSTTQAVTTFTATGTVGNVIELNTSDLAGQFTLSKSSGVVNCDYLDISNSNATGGAKWFAGSHSADTTNNDGWKFHATPVGPLPAFFRP